MSTSFNLPKHTPTTSDNAGAAFLSLPRFSSRYGVIHLSSSCPLRLLNLLSQFFIVVLNPVLSVVSYSFAAQSMLTPFAGLSIVWSLLFSSLLLPESIDSLKVQIHRSSSPYIPFSILKAPSPCKGCILISLSATHSPVTLTVADLITLSFQSSSVLFNTLYSLSLLFLLFVSVLLFHVSVRSIQGVDHLRSLYPLG